MLRSSPPPLAGLALGLLLATALPAQAPPADPLARAQAAVDAGDAQTALALVEPILKRDRKHARALLVRSTAHCLEGDLPACKTDLEAALKSDPSLRQGWLNRSALAISEQRYEDALGDLTRAEQIDPQATDNGLNQGAVLLLAGRLEPAAQQFRRYLEVTGRGEDWYLVATNYAFSGYAALAVEHLTRAIELDEPQRARARVDPNFAELARHRAFQALMSTDSHDPGPGALTAERTFNTRYAGADSPVLTAALNAVQNAGLPLGPIVDVTPDWAVLWSRFRIKLAADAKGTTTIRLTAPAGTYTPDQWSQRTDAFFTALERELLRLELARSRDTKTP